MVPEVESGGSKSFVKEVVRDEDTSSPLSTSPSAKMIKIEEIADVPSHSPEQYVALFSYWLNLSFNFFAFFISWY